MHARLSSYAPLAGLLEGWQLKLPLAAGLGIAMEALRRIGALYAELLSAPTALVAACVLLLLLDMVTGMAAAVRRGERIASRALRRTSWKVIEYAAVGLVGVTLSNAFSEGPFALLTAGLGDASLLYIALTEGLSVLENVTGSRSAALALLQRLRAVWARGGDVDIADLQSAEDVVPPEDHRTQPEDSA